MTEIFQAFVTEFDRRAHMFKASTPAAKAMAP
jgi:hypothetical protein